MRNYGLAAATGAALMFALASGAAMAQTAAVPDSAASADAAAKPGALPTPLPNQTLGFGNGKPVLFTYTENFDCVDEPTDDLNYNGILAESDPSELQIPICQVGGPPPTDEPTGAALKKTDILYVMIPFFSVTPDTNPADALPCPATPIPGEVCGSALGTFLINAFGSIPEGFRTTPEVSVQCPNPSDPPGSCTMHGDSVDLSPLLAALDLIPSPPTANVIVPLPNHSHLIFQDLSQKQPQWWYIIPVLVKNASDWPPADGSSGITTVKTLQIAENDGDATEVPSNFFLFFGSQIVKTAKN